jgi:hypothetical protein
MTQTTKRNARLTTETTGRQQRFRYGVATSLFESPGLGPAPAGAYDTYRQMLEDPTVALARMVVMAPILAGAWSYDAPPETPAEWVALIRGNLGDLRGQIVKECLRALDFGWQACELVYGADPRIPRMRDEAAQGLALARPGRPGPTDLVRLVKVKPLLQDISRLRIDPATGAVVGIENDGVVLPREKCLLYVHEETPDNPYGRARLENIRGAWSAWHDCQQGAARYDRKIAGVIPVVHYPPGLGYDIGGAAVDHYTLATRLLETIAAGKGLAVPNEFAADVDDREHGRPEKRKWIIELLEDRGGRQPGFIERLRYLDSLKMRGYLRPERTALESGGAGLGHSDVAQHVELALADGELLHQEICAAVNAQVVDRLLALNFGPGSAGGVRIVPAPLTDRKVALFGDLVRALAQTPAGLDLLRTRLDIDAVLEVLGLPKAKG